MKQAIVLLFSLSAWAAAPQLVTVTDTLRNADTTVFSGTLAISNGLMNCSGVTVPAATRYLAITAGVLSTSLYATADCGAGQGYAVRYTAAGITRLAYWVIPASPTTTTVAAIQTAIAPSPSMVLLLSQLGLGTVADGEYLRRSGSGWIGGAGAVSSVFTRTGVVTAQTGDYAAFYATLAALDLKAPLLSPAFTGIPTGITKAHVGLGSVDNTADSTKPVSTAQQTALDLKAPLASPTFTGAFDASGATTTKPIKTGTVLPGTCATGETFFKTDATAGSNISTCIANVWTTVAGSYTLPAATASVRGGITVGTGLAITGDVLRNTAPAVANYAVTFTAVASVTTLGTTHGLASANLISDCKDGSVPRASVSGYQFTVNATTFDVVITFPVAFTGTCVLNVSGGGTGGGSGDVVGPASAVDSQVVLFNTTTGKLVKAYAGTGVVKVASGVPSVVTGVATNCVFVNGTSGACGAVTAGTGISVVGSVVSVDTAVVPTFLAASSSIDFVSIAANSCAINTFAFTGAVVGDAVIGGWPAGMSTGIIPRILISTTNTVQIQLCNVTAGAIDPPVVVYGATIVRSF